MLLYKIVEEKIGSTKSGMSKFREVSTRIDVFSSEHPEENTRKAGPTLLGNNVIKA